MPGAKLEGLGQVQKRLNAFKGRYVDSTGAALYLEGQFIIADSVEEVPVHKSRLENSKYVALPQKIGGAQVVEIGYGAEYAPYVHEMTGPNVRWNKPGSKAKYLEDPFNRAIPGMGRRVAKSAKRFAERGVSFGGVTLAPKQPTTPGSEDQGGGTRP